MSLTATVSGFVVFVLSVSVVQGYHYGVSCTSTRICASKGSTVDINCTYPSSRNYPTTTVKKKVWFIKWRYRDPEDLTTDPQYAGRVEVLEPEEGRSTLRIKDLRESDSTKYCFTFKTQSSEWRRGLPGTTLTVTDVTIQLIGTYRQLKLQCITKCPYSSTYVWYRNGQKLSEGRSYLEADTDFYENSYSCALKGYEEFHSTLTCGNSYVNSCNRVTYTERRLCAAKGSSVDITCTYSSYNRPVVSNFWFSSERGHQWQYTSPPEELRGDSQHAGRVKVLEPEGGRSTLRITNLSESDSAQYRFKFKTLWFEWRSSLPGTTLTVTALQVQVTRATVRQSYTEAELKCVSSCSPAGRLSYVWFKNGHKNMAQQTSTYTDHFYPGDIISCAFTGHEGYPSPPVYAPNVILAVVTPSGDTVEGRSVNLSCSSDANPAANYTWYKTRTLVSKERQLFFRPIHSSDSGEYYCVAKNELGKRKSAYISINVKYPPTLPSVSVSPRGEIVENSTVTLTCSTDANPTANYTWYKDNQTLLQEQEGIYRFTSISSEDRGTYYCTSENQFGRISSTSKFIDVQYAPKLPSVSASPSGGIVEGTSVTLTCSSDANPAAEYTWYKEDEDWPKDSGQNFTITDFRHEHSSNYYCEAQNTRGRRNSALHLISATGSLKSAAVGSITVIFLAITFLYAFLLIRRKRSSKQISESRERPVHQAQQKVGPEHDGHSAAAQRRPAAPQDGLLYANVTFSKNQEDSLYSNVSEARADRQKDDEEWEDVEYSVVNFTTGTAGLGRQEAEEDPSALYSTVNKNHKV